MAFSDKIPVSINRDVILYFDFIYDPIEGKNIAKTSVKDETGKDIPTFRTDYKMDDNEKTEYEHKTKYGLTI